MFRHRLLIAFASVALVSLSLGTLGWWLIGLTAERLAHSRGAGDVVTGFVDLSAAALRLDHWSASMLLGAEAQPGQGEALIDALSRTLERLRGLHDGLATADHGRAASEQRARRGRALAALQDKADQLKSAVEASKAAGDRADLVLAERIASILTPNDGRPLVEIVDAATAQERSALELKRTAADGAVEDIRIAVLGTTLFLILLAILLYLHLASTLRRPLSDLERGAAALGGGDLGYRLPETGHDEFTRFARSVNRMANELVAHRQREARERHRLEEAVQSRTAALDEAMAELRGAEARRLRLLADLSHDLRTPTAAIIGQAEVTLRGAAKPAAEYHLAVEAILSAARNLAVLLDRLLRMAQGEAGADIMARDLVDVRATLQEAVAQGRSLGAQRGIRIETDIADPPFPAFAVGDGGRLLQMFANLVENAVHYSHTGSMVRVEAGTADLEDMPAWSVVISDHGLGIAAEDLPHVFERNYRGAAAIAQRADGSGLGLSIARSVARHHGGKIHLESSPEAGTTARVLLPLAPATSYIDS